jgi:hypothetical protein
MRCPCGCMQVAVALLSLALLALAPADEEQLQGTKPKTPANPPGESTAVAAPILSTAACKNDRECVPATACHASACTSAARRGEAVAEPCTMECRGGTVDCGYNHCACVKGRSGKKVCALVPGPK